MNRSSRNGGRKFKNKWKENEGKRNCELSKK
jgi:hypothetical protein